MAKYELEKRMMRTRRAGTSLVELLVVIVVFLVGILAMLQIFPGGFRLLKQTSQMRTATALARAESERLKAKSDSLPEMILPVYYVLGASTVSIVADTSHTADHLSHDGEGMSQIGHVISGGNDIGLWEYLVGANRIRRIVGEGGPVPAPRQVGAEFGGLMILSFAPIAFDPSYPQLLQVYGNDMVKREGVPGFRVRPWEYFLEDVEEPTARIYLPRGTTRDRLYRLTMSAWIQNGGTTSRRTIVDALITVPFDALGGAVAFDLSNYAALQPGETFVGVEWDSVRVARAFERVGAFTAGEPYEYKLLDNRLGTVLFNPAGHGYQETRPGRRVPLVARVNYDVFDWRIIRDEFRITNFVPFQQRLQLGNLKVKGMAKADGQPYGGLDVLVANGSGGTETRDLLLVDQETGGVYTPDSYTVDKSIGLITYIDTNAGAAGLQMRLILPGQASSVEVTAPGRAVRALYEANGEWSVQVMKAASQYTVTFAPPSVGQYYVGTSSASGGSPTRVYFPLIDVGRKITIGELWYRNTGGQLKVLRDQDFLIQNTPLDPLGPYVDITSVDPNAGAFDFTNGYSVRRVKGASTAVRVLWNPDYFALTANASDNNNRFEQWTRGWRKTTVETFLQRGEN